MNYLQIVKCKKKMSISLSIVLILGVLGFLIFACTYKDLAVYQPVPGLSLGLAAAIGIILFAGILAFYYAWWMNYVYDKAISKLKEKSHD